ncbi:hypothetical protein BS78_02G322600 [Paspalum vaginatum]|nr:hypothetical protein BS78_02G322600 [Paspalum vaginatum]
MERLPGDLVADEILGRLPPSSLATARCVGKYWCSLIDAQRLLRAKTGLLPLRLDGIFCNSHTDDQHYPRPYFFARPSTARRIDGHLDLCFDPNVGPNISDHCNGLLLLGWDMAVEGDLYPCFYLAYDPIAASPHHFESKWPPSPYTTHVCSSSKWRWEERSFIREGEGAGTVADMVHSATRHHHGVYFRGALYVHCQNDSMIKSPLTGRKVGKYDVSYLGKSQKGVHSGLLYWGRSGWPHFRVWLLNDRKMEWVLTSNISLQAVARNFDTFDFDNRYDKPWILADCHDRSAASAAQEDETVEFDNEWDFDNGGIILETREIVLFCSKSTVLCYQLNTSKVQELGLLDVPFDMETSSFLYTPCWMRMRDSFSSGP